MASKVNYIISESAHDFNNLEISETFISNRELEDIFWGLSSLPLRQGTQKRKII